MGQQMQNFYFLGFVVNGEITGKKKVFRDGNIHTYFGRFGITHQKLGVRLEVSTQDISVFHDGKQFKLLWSDAASIKETKWVMRHSDLLVWKHHNAALLI